VWRRLVSGAGQSVLAGLFAPIISGVCKPVPGSEDQIIDFVPLKSLPLSAVLTMQGLRTNKVRDATGPGQLGWERAMRQFAVGEVVTWIPHLISRSAAGGDYKITAAMPDRDGDRMYRIKSPLEEHERVVAEDLLMRSEGRLPEETMQPIWRRHSITLPTLRQRQDKLELSASFSHEFDR
jgi:hypothetical protein